MNDKNVYPRYEVANNALLLLLVCLSVSVACVALRRIRYYQFNQSICVSTFPTAYVSGSFAIAESSAGEFGKNQSNKTIIFNLPAGFSFNTTVGTYSVTGVSANDITSITISAITASSITLRVSTANSVLDLNTITISCQIRSTAAGSGTLIRNGGTFKIGKSTAKPTTSESLGNMNAQATMTYNILRCIPTEYCGHSSGNFGQ